MWVESVNSTIFVWHVQKLRKVVYLRTFSIVDYWKFNSSVSLFQRCMSWVFDFRYAQKLKHYLYSRPFTIAIYRKFDLFYPGFFLACKLDSSGLQIMLLISNHLRFMASVDIRSFWYWDIKKGQIQFLVTFLAGFFSGL